MVCGPVMQCNFLSKKSCNSPKSGTTSTLRETLRRVAYHETNKVLARDFATAFEESWNLVLLPAAVKATCCVRGLTIARCVTRRYVSFNLSRRLKEDIARHVARQAAMHSRIFVNASVFLASCGGLLVKKKTTPTPFVHLFCVLLC